MKMKKKIFANDLNNLKDFVTEKIENKFKEFEDLIINEKLKEKKLMLLYQFDQDLTEKFILFPK